MSIFTASKYPFDSLCQVGIFKRSKYPFDSLCQVGILSAVSIGLIRYVWVIIFTASKYPFDSVCQGEHFPNLSAK